MKDGLQYRPDIDGLRAISVLAVIAFHLKIGLGGGFTGVDVFFVISGCLIGRIVYSEVDAGHFSLLQFYERRARRILPALLATIAVSWFIAGRQLYPFEKADFSKSALASILFAANLYFYEASGYFAPAAETIPLLHLWSLGVEEQFYLLFPPAILLLARTPSRRALTVLAAAFLLSLLASQSLLSRHPDAAFYLPVSRAFEILLGALIAHPVFPRAQSQRVCQYVAILGLTALLASMIFFAGHMPFPGAAALVPCGGAAMVLWSGQSSATLVSRLLGSRVPVLIGKLSYSLYLVHWPVIVFGRSFWPDLAPLPFALAALAVSFALAAISYWCIETPLRYGALVRRRPLAAAAVGMLVVGILPIWTLVESRVPSSADPTINSVLRFNDYNPRTRFLARECFLDPEQRFEDFRLDKCVPPSTNDQVILWGDSHAAHLYYGLRAELAKANVSVGMLAASGCPPIVGLDIDQRPKCRAINNEVLPLLLRQKPRIAILSAAWHMNDGVAPRLKATVDQLLAAGIEVVILSESPAFSSRAPSIAAALLQEGKPPIASAIDAGIESMKLADAALLAKFGPTSDVAIVSPLQNFCSEQGCHLLTSDNVPIYFDYSHLTEAGSLLYARAISAAMARRKRE